MRAIPEAFDRDVVTEIDRRLDRIEETESVAITWAIESGSRAWGFPSPDSDYDCRFIYLRSERAYLSPWLDRDVIETPLDKIVDVNGWDLRKAIQLAVKGNAVVVEWLRSPYVYRGSEEFRTELLDMVEAVADRPAVGRHYSHVCRDQWGRYGGGGEVSLKRFLYALRPAASIRWLESHPDSASPPMDLGSLLAENGSSVAVREATDELIALKARTREMGDGLVPDVLATYVSDALELGMAMFDQYVDRDLTEVKARAASTFRSLVRAHGPSSV
ncbi:nucleotidyltransferase domain-containing protein [Aeromicrobium panaciterrae]|uniref:nucleotidyltransferase domain-containing protein n=1 Tax=Aeromicrobium panaciterrae TaxID=363861 RepID=UPI0031D0238D